MDVKQRTPMTLSDIDNASSKNQSAGDDLGDVSLDYEANKDITSSSVTKELEPLVGLEAEGVTEGRSQIFSCWKCKYNWRFFLPIACCCRGSEIQNEDNSGFLEVATLSWVTGIFVKGFKKTLTSEDLGELSRSMTAEVSKNQLIRYYAEVSTKKNGSDFSPSWAFWRIVRTKILWSVFLLLLYVSVEFTKAAVVLKGLLSYIEKPYGSIWDGLEWCFLLGFFGLSRSTLMSSAFYLQLRAGITARAAALSFIYYKLSKLKSVGNKSVGELVNLCANDSQRIFECCQFSAFLFGAPFLTLLISVYLYLKFGPSSLIGIGIMIMFLPIQAVIGRMIARTRGKVIGFTDQRVKMINEIVTCIKLIKMYGWEKSFAKVVRDIRSKEKKLLVRLLFMTAINMSMALLLSSIAPVATFAAHIAFGKDLSVSDAFTIMVMFNIFPPNIALLPVAVRGISEARNAMKRIKSLLQMEDYVPFEEEPADPSLALVMKDCNFSWVEPEDTTDSKVSKKPEKEENKQEGSLDAGKSEQSNGVGKCEEPSVKFKKTKHVATAAVSNEDSPSEKQLTPTLFGIDLSVKKGSLVGVCGSVGSGKSSLIQSILGQMDHTNGSVQVVKLSAYVPQQAWIINDTIRNNITFGRDYDEQFFQECCRACALDKDMKGFESGDLTEIGERGINLSGGQKQRVSLARALYADADLYLLDDPLSAVDSHVGRFIFTNYIKDKLRDKACVFVTHQLQYLQDCDEVMMMSNGRIKERGTYTELMNAHKDFCDLITKFNQSQEREESKIEVNEDTKQEPRTSHTKLRKQPSIASSVNSALNCLYDSDECSHDEDNEEERIRKGKIIAKEESSVGSVSWKVYCAFMKAGGGYIISIMAILMQMSVLGIIVFVEWWLSNWLDRASKPIMFQNETRVVSLSEHPDSSFFMTIYATVGSSMFLAQMIASMIFTFLFVNASTNLHNGVLDSILKCPMNFYDSTPTGRILNRFSRDVDEIDGRLSWTVESLIRNIFRIFTALLFAAIIFPWLLIGLVLLSVVFVFLFMLFRRTSREIKRIDNVTRSPVFSLVTATVQGLPVLRAFNKGEYFRRTFDSYVNKNSLPLFLFFLSGRWFSVRLDLLSVILSTTTAILAVITQGSIAPAFAALAIMYSLRITGLFQFTCRLAAESEARFTSVERMTHYTSEIEHEGPFETERDLANWPCAGKIDFVDVNLRYRPNLPLVLRGVSFAINAKEKVGIAGRTGAGKSSLAVALFRLTEIDDGKILIDDEDTASVGLTKLRSRLSIIPQDPVLFIGTIRYNLDPFDQHTDEKLWLALEKAYMKDVIAGLPMKLETLVVENGENFSVGERQLICMARALLQESKILLLDEATAAIDSATDAKIQITIRESFKDCTVLTIAHRLNTIMECDRILVMDDGKVAEFDTPSNLMSSEDSMFAKMAKSSSISK